MHTYSSLLLVMETTAQNISMHNNENFIMNVVSFNLYIFIPMRYLFFISLYEMNKLKGQDIKHGNNEQCV